MSVKKLITNIIKEKGFITIDEFMEKAMTGYDGSYYIDKEPIGESGDFITSPEISQMFGEMIAIWAIDIWNKLGRPKRCNIVEYGAGTGKLMHDLLRASKIESEFYNCLDIWIIDINPKLKNAQKKLLSQYKKIEWVDSIDEVSKYPTIILANEFFDALPIKQYEKDKNNWKEKILVLDAYSNLKPDLKEIDLSINHHRSSDGAVYEESPESIRIVKNIASHIEKTQGAALIIDYGYDINPQDRTESQYNSTLQAIKNHKYIDIYHSPGECDLTAHVDFGALKNAASTYKVNLYGSIPQNKLLRHCGIDIRLESLTKHNPDLSEVLKNQYHRLMDEDKMGTLFKAIAIFSEKSPPLGFGKL